MNANDFVLEQLVRTATTPTAQRESRNRAHLAASRRQDRRHRLAERVRSVADRLEA